LIVAFDNTFLSLVLNPNSKPRPNPATGQPVEYCKERVEALVDNLSRRGDTVVIPTPCFSEMLCAVPDLEKAIVELNRSTAFDLASFDERCAIDLAEVVRKSIASGDKRGGVSAAWAEVKFDRQIAVTAKVNGAEILYTDDENQAAFAQEIGLRVVQTWDLDLPPEYAQTNMKLDG
jgi:predicted nucleic acid-binding protein